MRRLFKLSGWNLEARRREGSDMDDSEPGEEASTILVLELCGFPRMDHEEDEIPRVRHH